MAKAQGYLRVTNWNEYQHYKDRRPTWIKFQVATLDSQDLREMPIATRLLWDQMLLLAARFENAVEYDVQAIAKATRIDVRSVREGIRQLVAKRMLKETRTRRKASPRKEPDASDDASNPASESVAPYTETEEQPEEPLNGYKQHQPVFSGTGLPYSFDFDSCGWPLPMSQAEELAGTLRGSDDKTPRVLRSLSRTYPPSNFYRALEQLEWRRKEKPKLRSEAAYFVGEVKGHTE